MACRARCVGAAHRGARVLLVQSGDEDIVDEIADLIRDGGADPVLGTGRSPSGADGLRRALAEAMSAHQLALARPEGERVVRRLEVGAHRQLLDFLEPHVLRAFRDTRARPGRALGRGAQLRPGARRWRRFWPTTATGARRRRSCTSTTTRCTTAWQRVSRLTGRPIEAVTSRVDLALALAIPRVPPR